MVKKRYHENESLGLTWDRIGGVLNHSIYHYVGSNEVIIFEILSLAKKN